MKRYHSIIILLMISFAICFDLTGQQDVVITEADVEREAIFIEANQQKLLENYDKALELYLKLYRKDKSNPALNFEISRAYMAKEDMDNALKYSSKAVEDEDVEKWILIHHLELLEKASKHEDAAKFYEDLSKKNPNDEYYHIKWAFNALKAGDFSQALKVYDRIEKKKGISEDISHRKFEIYDKTGQTKKAIETLKALSDSDPDNTRYLNNLAGYYSNIGKEKEARKIFERIIEIDPNDANASIALAAKSSGTETEYLKALRGIIQNNQIDLDTKIKELIPYVSKLNPEDKEESALLLKFSDVLIEQNPTDPKVYALKGDIEFNADNLEAAEMSYKKALELHKGVFAIWNQLMITQMYLGKYDALSQSADQAMLLYPNQFSIYYFGAYANIELGNYSTAQSLMDPLKYMATTDNARMDQMFLDAMLLYHQENYQEAKSKIDELSSDWILENGIALELMGDLNYQFNEIGEAVKFWEASRRSGNLSRKLLQKIQTKSIVE